MISVNLDIHICSQINLYKNTFSILLIVLPLISFKFFFSFNCYSWWCECCYWQITSAEMINTCTNFSPCSTTTDYFNYYNLLQYKRTAGDSNRFVLPLQTKWLVPSPPKHLWLQQTLKYTSSNISYNLCRQMSTVFSGTSMLLLLQTSAIPNKILNKSLLSLSLSPPLLLAPPSLCPNLLLHCLHDSDWQLQRKTKDV